MKESRPFRDWWAQEFRVTLRRTAAYAGLFFACLFFSFAVSLSGLVGSSGFEPPTSRLSGARSNQLSYEPVSLCALRSFCILQFAICNLQFDSLPLPHAGGDDGIRTHDPLLAGQVLSQLSYTPMGVRQVPLPHGP